MLSKDKDKEGSISSRRSFSQSTRSLAGDSTLRWVISPEDGLLERYAKQKERLREAKRAEELRVKGECPFRPLLNGKSVAIAQQSREKRRLAKSVGHASKNELDPDEDDDLFTTLHLATKRSLGSGMPTACTFHPNISKCRSKSKHEYLAQPVSQRLAVAQQASEDRLQTARKQQEKADNFDATTGQRRFRPQISRGPKTNTRDVTKPLHEHLYKDSYLEIKRAKAQQQAQQRWTQLQTKPYSLERSKKLLDSSRKKKAAEVFKLLDPDDCGSIAKSHVRLDCKPILTCRPILGGPRLLDSRAPRDGTY